MSWFTPHTIPLHSSLPHPKVTKETKQKATQETKPNQTKKTTISKIIYSPPPISKSYMYAGHGQIS